MIRLSIGCVVGWVAAVLVLLSQCSCGGMELGGRVGVYSVQKHIDSSESAYRPISCLWKDCTGLDREVSGS